MLHQPPRPRLIPKIRKAECSQCGGVRNCDVRGEHSESYNDDHTWANTKWYILQCRGCEHTFIQTVGTNSEDLDYYEKNDGSVETSALETIKYWPALSERNKPEWLSMLGIYTENDAGLDEAMLELYGALDGDLRMLAAIGIRTAYDIASEILGIDPELPFTGKLNALVNSGRIGIVDKDRIETIVDAGSASAHRGWRPKPSDLNTMMDVLEHFIQESFVAPARRKKLDEDAAKMKKTVPPRSPKKKKL
jgi:hypothetical protein